MKRKPLSILLMLVMLLSILSMPANAAADLTLPSLAVIYKDHFLIGGCFGADKIAGDRGRLFFHHYNAMTAENAMKPESLYNRDREFDFSAIDALLAQMPDYSLHGHTLVWHQQSPAWLIQNEDGSPLTRARAAQNMANHIGAVAGHFAGKVYSWDVINEAIVDSITDPSNWKAALRQTGWFRAFANGVPGENGHGYVDFAFRQARAADPNAVLYYNDYGLNNPRKARAVAAMVKEINDAWLAEGNTRLLIEGIGMQGHYNLGTRATDVEASIKLFANLGVKLSITELDISAKPGGPSEMLRQAIKYAELFVVFKAHSHVIERVSFWGLDDATSWLNMPEFGGPGADPLLFRADMGAKPAFHAVASPEAFLREHRLPIDGGDIFSGSDTSAWLNAGLYSPNKFVRCAYTLLYWLLWPGARAVHWVKGLFG